MKSNGPVRCRRFWSLVVLELLLAVLWVVPRAYAEEPTIVGPVRASAPSTLFVLAQRVHDSGNYAEAASMWHQIVQRAAPDELIHREIAEYQLAVALARLGLSHASLDWFRAAAENGEHAMHRSALVQLGRIAANLPEISVLLPHFSSYSLTELDQLKDLPDDQKTALAYLLGRGHYHNRDYAEAQQAFARVSHSSPYFLEARLFESACHVRQRRSVPALIGLDHGIAAVEQGSVRGLDRQRWLDLLHLSQARIYYSSSIALDPETNVPSVNQSRISAAVKQYNLLKPESEYFQEATFELAWLYFMAGQYSFALGKIFTLDAPYYQDDVPPEAQMLKAVVYQANCNYDAAEIVRARFNKRYIPIRDELRKLLRKFKESEPGQLVRVLSEQRHRSVVVGPVLEPIVAAAYRERGFLRLLREADTIEKELALFQGFSTSLKASALGEQLRTTLDLRHQEATLRADQWLRAFFQRRVDEIDEHVRNGEMLLLNRHIISRNLLDTKLKSGQVSRVESKDWGSVHGDDEHVIWPFNGEYWRDELGTYRQTVLSACGR